MSGAGESHPAAADDPLYAHAQRLVLGAGTPSISLLIRSLGIGYSHATRLVQAMEGDVIVSGELERYTAFLQTPSASSFVLRMKHLEGS